MTLTLPASEDDLHPDAQPWSARGQGQQELPWVSLESSLQWQAFRRSVELLLARGNRVLIVPGPLNEHMLSPSNAEMYLKLREDATAWLRENGSTVILPPLLPSHLYADLSHPFSGGYALLAQEIWRQMEESPPRPAQEPARPMLAGLSGPG